MTVQRAAILIQDPALHLALGGHVSSPDGFRVLRTRWLGHRASLRVSCSVTPFVRHRPFAGNTNEAHRGIDNANTNDIQSRRGDPVRIESFEWDRADDAGGNTGTSADTASRLRTWKKL